MRYSVHSTPSHSTPHHTILYHYTRMTVSNLTQYGAFINALSPVFLTRGPGGQLVRGLQDVPTGTEGRPVLLVGNHQLYGV